MKLLLAFALLSTSALADAPPKFALNKSSINVGDLGQAGSCDGGNQCRPDSAHAWVQLVRTASSPAKATLSGRAEWSADTCTDWSVDENTGERLNCISWDSSSYYNDISLVLDLSAAAKLTGDQTETIYVDMGAKIASDTVGVEFDADTAYVAAQAKNVITVSIDKTPAVALDRAVVDLGDLGDWGDWKNEDGYLGRTDWPRVFRRLVRTAASPAKIRVVGTARYGELNCTGKDFFGNCNAWSRTPRVYKFDLAVDFSKAPALSRSQQSIKIEVVSWMSILSYAALSPDDFGPATLTGGRTDVGQGSIAVVPRDSEE